MPPLMAIVSGAVEGDEKQRLVNLMFVDVKKAHLNGSLKNFDFAFVSLREEAGGGVGEIKAVVV